MTVPTLIASVNPVDINVVANILPRSVITNTSVTRTALTLISVDYP